MIPMPPRTPERTAPGRPSCQAPAQPPARPRALALVLMLALAAPALGAPPSASSSSSAALAARAQSSPRCIDEEAFDVTRIGPGSAQAQPAGVPSAREAVQTMVRDALARSNAIGASRLLVEAAEREIEEAAAGRRMQAALTAALEPQLYRNSTDGGGSALGARAGLTLTQTLFDGGRVDRLVDWRRLQAEATRLGQLTAQEQISLATMSLALERSRYRMQVTIYDQYVRKMGCLVEALETIVSTDSGRTSELVQARKQLQQAELQQSQAVSQTRLIEARLRRVVGDGLPGVDGMAALMVSVPDLAAVLSAAEQSNDIVALGVSAQALNQYARAVEASTRPQVSWNVAGSAAIGAGSNGPNHNSGALSAGVSVSIPLLSPATDHSVQAARKRHEAANLQRAEVLESKRQRIVELHEQATAAFDRLQRVGLVLRDSERLRNFTLQQWQQLGRRSLFDVMGAEADHYNLRVQYVNALHDGQQFNATLTSMGTGLTGWLQ